LVRLRDALLPQLLSGGVRLQQAEQRLTEGIT
jgi:hypothetical protein